MQVEQQHRASAAWDIGDILHTELFSSTSSNPNIHTSPSTSFSASSRESTPMSQHLPTPPQQAPYNSFPTTSPQLGGSSSSGLSATDPASDNFFAFLDDADNTKGAHPTSLDPFSSPSLSMSMSGNGFDFGNAFDFSGMPMMMTSPMPGSGEASQDYSMNMDMMMNMGMGMGAGMGAMDMGIDPQLVDSPAPLVVMGEEEEDQEEGGDDEDPPQEEVEEEVAASSPTTRSSTKKRESSNEAAPTTRSKRGRGAKASASTTATAASNSSATFTRASTSSQQDSQSDRLTLTIAPVKVGGRGGARRGTVQSGGIAKKAGTPMNGVGNVAVYANSVLKPIKEDSREKENAGVAGVAKRGRGRKAAPAALPSPPSSHHEDAEEVEEDASPSHRSTSSISSATNIHSNFPTAPNTAATATPPSTSPAASANNGGTILTGNALVANGRKVTPFDLGIEGLSLSASFAIPPGTFNMTTPSAVGSSSGLGVGALMAAAGTAPPSASSSAFASASQAKYNFSAPSGNGAMKRGDREGSVNDEDGDEIPADWRPSPEALAKMTSKEKRQLRNKISARNFRVRRKEYISTLELDIAERDRLLDAIRTELGTSRNENVALRQEIEALKRTLIGGRGTAADSSTGMDYLPPPRALPERSAADIVLAQQQAQAQNASTGALLKPNTQKDVSAAGQQAFWGGGGAGGIVPVHTTFVPSVASGFANMAGAYGVAGVGVGAGGRGKLQENMNPLMRVMEKNDEIEEIKEEKAAGFEDFADVNMFTMKSMDSYRMHLWGKMAAQYHAHQQQQHHHQPSASPSPQQSPSPQTPSPVHQSPVLLQKIPIQQTSPGLQQIPVHQSPVNQQQQNLFLQQQQQQQMHLQQLQKQLWDVYQQTQREQQQQQQQSQYYGHPSGLASGMRPSYFTGVSAGVLSGKETSLTTRTPLGNVSNTASHNSHSRTPLLSALLSGKGSVFAAKSSSGDVAGEKRALQAQQEVERREVEKRQEQARAAVLAAVASQTVFKKLGQAFWDAFSGASSSSSSPLGAGVSPSYANGGITGAQWDAEKVRKVLDGRAVIRVVDVEPTVPEVKKEAVEVKAKNVSKGGSVSVPSSPVVRPFGRKDGEGGGFVDVLEEKMRGLALGGCRRKD